MEKKIVIADMDEEYLSLLEYKIVEEWEEKAEIEMITDEKYCREFFSQPRDIFFLVMDERLYDENVRKQNCRHIFLLIEDKDAPVPEAETMANVRRMFKYSSLKELYLEMMKSVRTPERGSRAEYTKLYAVYSPAGGTGKTLTALGICQRLSEIGKRVLYLNTETLPDFEEYLEENKDGSHDYAGNAFGYALAGKSRDIMQELFQAVGRDDFDYVKPFPRMLLSYQIAPDAYPFFVRLIRESGMYDVLVLELPQELTREDIHYFGQADKVVLSCTQRKGFVYRLEKLLDSVTLTEDRTVLVCNRFREDRRDYLRESSRCLPYVVSEYVQERDKELTWAQVREGVSYQMTAYTLE